MITLEVAPEELEVLVEELSGRLHELETELVHTDRKEFREMLKRRKTELEALLGRFRERVVPV